MKQHPEIGERIVVTGPRLRGGRPRDPSRARALGRRRLPRRTEVGGEIPLASRIVLVCDAFHAMTSDRPYRKAMNVEEARLELATQRRNSV